MSLADRLRAARTAAGLTQADVARNFKITPSAVAQWEMGRTGPDRARLTDLAALLGVTAGYMLGAADAPTAETQAGAHTIQRDWLILGIPQAWHAGYPLKPSAMHLQNV